MAVWRWLWVVGDVRLRVMAAYQSLRPSFFLVTRVSMRYVSSGGRGSVFPARGELVGVFVDVARQRHQVDVDLLQVVGAAGLLLDGRAADRQAVGRVDLDQAGRVHDLCGGVVGHD